MDDILKRRSIRRFVDRDVSAEAVTKILKAAMAAPSAGNQQPWQFIVVRDPASRKKVSECSAYAHSAAEAPVAIVVCGDLSREKHQGYWMQDCAAAVENMLIEVTSQGLGAVWLGVFPRQDRVDYLRKYFNLPENIVPFAVIPVGYPAQELPPADRYDENRVHYERW
ncbi:MAG TPA: nitroreductase family protein [Candidatus Omnitrophota bacterium]|nr:nitroreductase family protein [Candidatus Omnitrophota bacterium]HQJ15800.1 nitroreductase family protein [Candidatus Omnitrophota bacterium]